MCLDEVKPPNAFNQRLLWDSYSFSSITILGLPGMYYRIAGKFGGEFNLADWQICKRTAKLNSANNPWCHLVGGVWKLLTTSVRDECEASFEDGIVQVLYQRAPDIPYESPLSFRQTSRKNERRSEACARRGYLWARQVQRIYARRKSTDWKVCRWTWTRKGSQTFLKAFVQ